MRRGGLDTLSKGRSITHNIFDNQTRGRTVYTDNYYTSINLAKHLFEKYRWTLVGTIIPTDKKTREDHDIPFLKLSNGARKQLDRGWFW